MRASIAMFGGCGAPSRVSRQDRVAQAADKVTNERASRARWSNARKLAHRVVSSGYFEGSMAVLILLNMVFVVLEVNMGADNVEPPTWMVVCNAIVLSIYFAEACMKVFAFRSSLATDPLLMVDTVFVFTDITVTIVIAIMPISMLPVVLARVARVLKLTRALRAMTLFPELNILVKGVIFASGTVFWGLVLLIMTLGFWSIFATMFIHPIVKDLGQEGYWAALDCERCPRAFASVENSMLTFCQQLIVGEGWSEINTPLIEKRPETAIFFISVMASVMLAALNLLLGLIVERSVEAKRISNKELSSQKEKKREQASQNLLEMCVQMDADESGRLELKEILQGYQDDPDFADLLNTMDIEERDLEMVFSMLDTDGSGDVEYKEFVDQLHKLKSQESNTLLHFIKYYVMEILAKVNRMPAQPRRSRHMQCKSTDKSAPQSWRSPTDSVPSNKASGAESGGILAGSLLSHSQPPPLPDFEAELQKLSELQREVLSFSQAQVNELDRLHRRLLRTLDEAPARDIVDTAGQDKDEKALLEEPPPDAPPKTATAACGDPFQGRAAKDFGTNVRWTADAQDPLTDLDDSESVRHI